MIVAKHTVFQILRLEEESKKLTGDFAQETRGYNPVTVTRTFAEVFLSGISFNPLLDWSFRNFAFHFIFLFSRCFALFVSLSLSYFLPLSLPLFL